MKNLVCLLFALFFLPIHASALTFDGIVTNVSGTDVIVEMTHSDSKVGDHFRLAHITGSGMEIDAGLWKITSLDGRKVNAAMVKKKISPRKGMKAFLTPVEMELPEDRIETIESKERRPVFEEYPEDSLEDRAKTGDINAQAELGYQYLSKQDYQNAQLWFNKLAQINIPSGQRGLGWLYQNGLGVSKNMEKALEYYKKAADQNFSHAQNDLGWIYLNGMGVGKNKSLAVQYFAMAANNGFALAQDNLGSLYLNGNGVTKDYKKAFTWFQKSADQNHHNAMNSLGFIYYHGYGVTRDAAKALYWYEKAAREGNHYAQYNLADMLFHGVGTHEDKKQAMVWLKKSAQNGNKIAKEKLKELGVIY